ncbi:MAG TPA: RecB-like helicase [Campylobacterales bacterium]|nr:RecB-like helicase [Campylobacterales bacterium]
MNSIPKSFKPYLAYSASAGSGKTFALSVRYISLLFLDQEPSTILAATFTNKAAIEMKQRVVSSLINLADNKIFLNAISQQTGLSSTELIAKQPKVLENFLSSSNFIVTLDSFFTSILRSASLYIDIEPDFVTKEIDPKHKENKFLEEIEANSLLSSLVKLAMDIEDKRFLKIFDLMQNFYKIDPLLPNTDYKIENLSIIEEQIEQVRDELYNLVIESGASKTAIKNFEPIEVKKLFKKSVFEKSSLLEHRNYKKYVLKNPQIDELFLLLKKLLKEWSKAKEQIVLHNLFKLFDYYKNANIGTAKQLGVLSFDDLSYFTYRLLHESVSKEFLYFKIDSRFHHILLDEFQDTSTLQFLLLKPLIDEIFSGSQEFRSFFYVGDTKQSLYRFRGGVEELFESVANHYGIEIAQMDTNYRSSQSIVEQVNRWFEPTMQGYLAQKPHTRASIGYVEVIESDELIDSVIDKIEWMLSQGVNLSNIAILVSTNKDGANIQERCYEKGIHTRLKTSSSLKYIPKVASIVVMIEYLLNGINLDAKAMLQYIDKSIEDIDISWFNPFMEPMDVVHRLIVEFGYFENDLNLLKLLEFAADFSTLPDFIEEFALSSIEVASNSKEGAMIMTIHGSKGLEFERVIVVDRLKGNAPDRSALLYEYDESLYIQNIYYKMGGRENFDEHYQSVLSNQKELSSKDKMNLLYVALTRGVESMIVIRKPKASIFDDIGMRPITIGQFDTKFIEKPIEETPKSKIVITHYGIQEIESEEEEEEKDYDALLFGTAMHYTLEMMSSFSIIDLAQALVATKNRYGLELSDKQFIDIKKRILELVSNEKFKKLLDGATITKEQSISFNDEVKQIDLLLNYDNYNMVLDYKSSKKYSFKHISQVRYYKKIIGEITNKYTRGMIVYLLEDGVEMVEI